MLHVLIRQFYFFAISLFVDYIFLYFVDVYFLEFYLWVLNKSNMVVIQRLFLEKALNLLDFKV